MFVTWHCRHGGSVRKPRSDAVCPVLPVPSVVPGPNLVFHKLATPFPNRAMSTEQESSSLDTSIHLNLGDVVSAVHELTQAIGAVNRRLGQVEAEIASLHRQDKGKQPLREPRLEPVESQPEFDSRRKFEPQPYPQARPTAGMQPPSLQERFSVAPGTHVKVRRFKGDPGSLKYFLSEFYTAYPRPFNRADWADYATLFVLHLEGPALDAVRDPLTGELPSDPDTIERLLRVTFDVSEGRELSALLALEQREGEKVREFWRRFAAAYLRVRHSVSDAMAKELFVQRLRPEFRDVNVTSAETIREAVEHAARLEHLHLLNSAASKNKQSRKSEKDTQTVAAVSASERLEKKEQKTSGQPSQEVQLLQQIVKLLQQQSPQSSQGQSSQPRPASGQHGRKGRRSPPPCDICGEEHWIRQCPLFRQFLQSRAQPSATAAAPPAAGTASAASSALSPSPSPSPSPAPVSGSSGVPRPALAPGKA